MTPGSAAGVNSEGFRSACSPYGSLSASRASLCFVLHGENKTIELTQRPSPGRDSRERRDVYLGVALDGSSGPARDIRIVGFLGEVESDQVLGRVAELRSDQESGKGIHTPENRFDFDLSGFGSERCCHGGGRESMRGAAAEVNNRQDDEFGFVGI